MPAPDFRKRLVIALVAAALPPAANALDTGGWDSGEDSGDASPASCPTDEQVCISWSPDLQGACPDRVVVAKQLRAEQADSDGPSYARPNPSPGVFADGECCYELSWECYDPVPMGCSCSHGRPLIVDRRPLTADVQSSRDWFDPHLPRPVLKGLSPALRERAALWWASVALHEHASIASFHRTALDLLAVGAPAELLAAAQRAAVDEHRHARRAFTLATHFAGAPVGPGRIALGTSLPVATDRIALAVRTVREACVEETLSVAAAIEMRRQARDPAIIGVLDGIIRDEIRHAALAWRTIRWVVESEGASARQAIAAAFAEAPGPTAESPELPASLARFGCVSDAELVSAARQARRVLVTPLAERLCA